MSLIKGMRVRVWGILSVFGMIAEKGRVLFDLLVELMEGLFEGVEPSDLRGVVVDLGLEIFETVHDDLKIIEEEVLVEEVVYLKSDCVLKGDLG